MKNIETIIKEIGLEISAEQMASLKSQISENYKTIAEHDRKVSSLSAEKENLENQINDLTGILDGFSGVDVDDLRGQIDTLKTQVTEAQESAKREILARDQRDYLMSVFDKKGIASERMRSSLAKDITDPENGLRWKDGRFYGLDEYLASENEKEHFYKTEEELAGEQSAATAPKISVPSQTVSNPTVIVPDVPTIW